MRKGRRIQLQPSKQVVQMCQGLRVQGHWQMFEGWTITLYHHKQVGVCSDTNMHTMLHIQEERTLMMYCSKAVV